MLSYSKIIKQAYDITLRNPLLWLFGLFVVGGFNLNFLHYANIPLKQLDIISELQNLAQFFKTHPAILALASFTLLFFSILSLVVTNWSRIMLAILGEAILKKQYQPLESQVKKSLYILLPTIRISLMTASFILFTAAALFGPVIFLNLDPQLQTLLLIIAAIIFLPLAFAISCLNIFTTFYLVLQKQSWGRALSLATDFFISRWTQILGLVIGLMVIYLVSFVLGVSIIYITRAILRLILETFWGFQFLELSAIILLLKAVSSLLLWGLLAGLSVFFNQALLILFFELNKPLEKPEAVEQVNIVPAPSASA